MRNWTQCKYRELLTQHVLFQLRCVNGLQFSPGLALPFLLFTILIITISPSAAGGKQLNTKIPQIIHIFDPIFGASCDHRNTRALVTVEASHADFLLPSGSRVAEKLYRHRCCPTSLLNGSKRALERAAGTGQRARVRHASLIKLICSGLRMNPVNSCVCQIILACQRPKKTLSL